jgi:hypothetical protein
MIILSHRGGRQYDNRSRHFEIAGTPDLQSFIAILARINEENECSMEVDSCGTAT